MIIGVAYYPEQWPEDRWSVDARMMKDMGVDVVRMGEFAWSRLEPKRLQYDMAWLHRAIEAMAAEGLKVILCTPTAAPPSWLFNRHPSMTPQDPAGGNWFPGSRRHVCLNNRPYLRYARRIVREMARSFGGKSEVFAWQLDDQLGSLGSGRCYCDDCEQAFREWLRGRYGTIDRLNRMWGTAFWSQEFADWHLIRAPRRTPGGSHPSLALDYERFLSATVREFVRAQRELVEQYCHGTKLFTTNTTGLVSDQIDLFSLAVPQDVASVVNRPAGSMAPDDAALQLDLTRSVRRKPFWILGQQAGAVSIRGHAAQPKPGQLRLWSYQAAARGAEMLLYAPWRTPAAGQQMHWDGILAPDGSTTRRYDELKQTVSELKALADVRTERLPNARVAMVLDYHSHWGLSADTMGAELDYLEQFRAWYGVFRRKGLAVDVIPPERDPQTYSLLVCPAPMLAQTQDVARWQRFVEEGGVLLVTAPAGYRTQHNTLRMGGAPGPLSDVLGVRLIEHDVVDDSDGNSIAWAGDTFSARGICSVLEATDAEVLATYASDYYAGKPAVTRRAQGKGCAYFLGSLSSVPMYDRLAQVALESAQLEPQTWASESVEVVPLQEAEQQGSDEICFVLNHSAQPVELDLPGDADYEDVISGAKLTQRSPLDGYGVLVLRRTDSTG